MFLSYYLRDTWHQRRLTEKCWSFFRCLEAVIGMSNTYLWPGDRVRHLAEGYERTIMSPVSSMTWLWTSTTRTPAPNLQNVYQKESPAVVGYRVVVSTALVRVIS